MELRSTREMRRNEQPARAAAARKADTADGSAQAQPARQGALLDKVSWSRQAIDYMDQQRLRLQDQLEERRARQQNRLAEARGKSDELDILSRQMELMEACMKIARSIMQGDKVPLKDLKFLMENDPAGYKLAMAMRREKKDPEELESVVEELEERHAAEGENGGGEAPAASAPAAPSGGGEASAPAE